MSAPKPLELETFEQLLQIHGARVERWPEAFREPLGRLIESSESARSLWAEAARLDALLDGLPAIEPAPDLLARITALPARYPRPERAAWWPFGNPLTPLLAWGAAAALGVWMGVVMPGLMASDLVQIDTDAPAVVALAGGDDDGTDDWTDVSGLAMGADWASEDE